MTVKLSDELHTRYVINALFVRLQNKLNEFDGTDTIVDLSGCRFGPRCVEELNKHYGKITFINSTEPELDALLKSNTETITAVHEDWPELDIATLATDDFIDNIKNIKAGQYKPKFSTSDSVALNIVRLILLSRPDVDLDLSECMGSVTSLIVQLVAQSEFNNYDKMIEIKVPNARVVNTDAGHSKDCIYLPYSVGTEKVIDLDKMEFKSQYEDVFNNIMDYIFNGLHPATTVENVNNIFDFLVTRDMYNAN